MIIPADLMVEAVVAGAAGVAAGVLAVWVGGLTGAVGTASATGLLAVSAGAGAAVGVGACFRGRADDGVR